METSAILSDEELRSLSDSALVRLIQERAGVDRYAAREMLTVIRDEIPADTVF